VHTAPTLPQPREGLAFPLELLQFALAWAASSQVRLVVATDHPDAIEALEIFPPGSAAPRFFVRRDEAGGLRVDDGLTAEFGLAYGTLIGALRFISQRLAGAAHRPRPRPGIWPRG
jgi:hypothetical protein